MKTIPTLVATAAIALSGAAVETQARTLELGLKSPDARESFLSDARPVFMVAGGPDRRGATHLAQNGGPGSIPTIDDKLVSYLPNARVTMVLQQVSNTITQGDGIGGQWGETVDGIFKTSSSEADDVGIDEIYNQPLPDAGDTDMMSLVLYDALVIDGCDNFPATFPVDHEVEVQAGGVDVGGFHGVDNSTIDSTGYYNFNYSVTAEDGSDASRIQFSGVVNVVCSAKNSL